MKFVVTDGEKYQKIMEAEISVEEMEQPIRFACKRLANKVNIGGPVLIVVIIGIVAVAECGDVVGESVYPYIYYMLFIKGNRNTPIKACS